jgi:hypothetical protein
VGASSADKTILNAQQSTGLKSSNQQRPRNTSQTPQDALDKIKGRQSGQHPVASLPYNSPLTLSLEFDFFDPN